MKLENQVCTLAQSLRLKELGISQDSYISWCGHQEHRLMDNGKEGASYSNNIHLDLTEPYNNMELDHRQDVPSDKPFAAAFTAAELIKMNGGNGGIEKGATKESCDKWYRQTAGFGNDEKPVFTYYDSFAHASADKLINALENKWLDSETCNNRLSE